MINPPSPREPRPPREAWRRILRAGAALLVLAAPAGGVFAQYVPTRGGVRAPQSTSLEEGIVIGPFLFSPSFAMNLAYDSNVFKVEDGFDYDGPTIVVTDDLGHRTKVGTAPPQHAQGDLLMTAFARLALKLPYSHSYTALIWTPQRSDYARITTPLKNSHVITLDNKLNFSNASSIRLQHDFASGFFETRRLEGQFQLNATPYQRNTTQLDYDWPFASSWGVAGKLQRTDYVFDRTQAVAFRDTAVGRGDSETGQYDLFDYVSKLAEVRGYRNFMRFQIYAGVSVGRTDQDRRKFNESQLEQNGCNVPEPVDPQTCTLLRAQAGSEEINQVNAQGGIKGNLSRKTVGDLSAGFSTWRFRNGSAGTGDGSNRGVTTSDDSTKPFTGLTFSANVDHTFNSRTFAHARLQRIVNQATGQYTGYYIRHEGVFWLERKLTMQVSLAAGIGANYRGYPASESRVEVSTNEAPGTTVKILETEAFSVTDYYGFLDLRYRPGRSYQGGPLTVVLSYAPRKTMADIDGLNMSGQRLSLSLQYGWF